MALLTAAASMLSPACSDDNGYYITPSEDTDGFVLMLPSITTFDTRADEYGATAEELKYSSLTFFAFPVEGGEVKTVKLITNESESGDLNLKDNYTSYPIELKPGKYRFYLTANYFGTTSISSLPQTETDLKAEKIVYENSFTGAISEKGLPMSCDHSNFHTSQNDGTLLGEQPFEVKENANQEIYADLTFACAKVSVTANDMQGATALISSLGVSNISANVPIIKNDNFVNDQTGYGKIDAITVKENATADEAPATLSFYIPERIVSETNTTLQSSATVKIGEKEIKLPLGEPTVVSTTETNPLPDAGTHRAIKRGTHYIYTLNAKAATLKVEPWSVEKILYNIQGQYFLHVEKTAYPIETGKTTAIWYDSNTTLVLESPKYPENSNTDLYKYQIKRDSIYVFVNPTISSSEYDNIRKNENNYNFFHIVAGNIHKRITVTPLKLINYLNVTPLNMSIDVREQIASGYYSNSFPILIDTNIKKVKITRGQEWSNLPNTEWGSGINPEEYVIMLADKDGNQIEVKQEGAVIDIKDGSSELNLKFKGLNSGKETWKQTRQLTFTVTAIDEDGNPVKVVIDESGATKELSETATINIIPNIQNYKIHFKANGWTNPHIYVYQCLEFPSDVKKTDLANKPIATGSDGNTAALEYSFTGKIAFKGWDTENPYNDPNAAVSGPTNGFYYFNCTDGKNTGSWSAGEGDFTKHYYDNMDFCLVHRNSLKDTDYDCQDCRNEKYNKLWPGIKMKKGSGASEGWWDFELTGVAEPGKALIMFANGHDKSNTATLRFPDSFKVGIPLFDFPDREGWLYYNGSVEDRVNNVFVNENPSLYE